LSRVKNAAYDNLV